MEILRNIKNQPPLSPTIQTFLIHLPQLQLLYLFFINQEIPFYNDIMDLVKIDSQLIIQILVVGQLCLSLFCLIVVGLRKWVFRDKKSSVEILVLKFLKVKVKILIVISLNWNMLAFKYCPTHYIAIAVLNILITIGELLITRIINCSYRFQQDNLICQKNTSLFHSMLLFPIVYLINFNDLFYAACLILIRCMILLYSNFNNIENRAIQYCDYFNPLVMLSFCVIELLSHTSGIQFLDSQSILFFSIVLITTIYATHSLTETLLVLVPKYHLKKCSFFTKNDNQQSFVQTGGSSSVTQDQEQQFIVALRVLAKVYVTKQKSQGLFFMRQKKFLPWVFVKPGRIQRMVAVIQQNHHQSSSILYKGHMPMSQAHNLHQIKFKNNVWHFLVNHVQFLTKSDKLIEQHKLSIIEKYFYIELLQKPIKNYYQLIKLKSQIKKSEQILEVESLMMETRQMFEHLFSKEKVQNQDLQIGELLEFQKSLKDMKGEFIDLSSNYKKFYDLFSNSFVEVPLLKKLTSDIMTVKKVFTKQIDTHMIKFSRNLQFLSFCLIYYKYFDEYTENLAKIQSKIATINEINNAQLQGGKIIETNNRKNIDVLDPIYGAIKIDLVWRPGEILSATRNVCSLLGFRRDQVEGKKINKIMPYIFARYHDRYLKNFIQKGSISMLKQKERIFYARNAQKFIFPISVRLKIEYLSSQSFSASSLIKKTSTKSQFVLLSNYGKIEEISQNLYRLLFQKSLKDEVSKVKRINIFKMILSLNHFIKNPSQIDDRIYEGTITTVQTEELLQQYYKFLQLGMDKNRKRGQNSNTNNSDQLQSNRSHGSTSSFLSNESLGSFSETMTGTESTYDGEKCKTDMKEMLRDFYSRINLDHIKAYKVMYKLHDLVTSEFTCKVLQVVNIKEELPQNVIKVQLPKQMIEIGQLYNLGEDELNKFRNIQVKIELEDELRKSAGTVMNSKDKKKTFLFNQDENSQDSVEAQQNQRPYQIQKDKDIENGGSISSLNSNTQKIQLKSTITTSFNLKISINNTLESILTVLILLVASTLIIICFFSTTIQPDYDNLHKDNLIISNFKINFEFRLAVQELYHFYHPLNMEPPHFLLNKKHLITDSMKEQLMNSVKWIDNEIGDELYFDPITLTHMNSGFKEQRPIISTLIQIYSMFLMTQEQDEHLSDNYEVIRNHLEELSTQQEQIIINASSNFRIKIHAILGIYALILIVITVIFAMIYRQSEEKQQKIIDFLPFVNIKHVREKMTFYENLIDYLKETEQLSISSIQTIEKQSTAQFQEEKQKKNLSKSKKNYSIMDKIQAKNNQQKIKSTKNDSSTRFIRVVKGNQKTLTFKNLIIMFLLAGVCFAVIIETEYFFLEAHSKFLAYIKLKDSAMMIESLAPRTLLTYLINIDKIVHFQEIVPFLEYYYEAPVQRLFDLRLYLAKTQNNGTQLAKSLENHFNHKICELIECNDDDFIANSTDIYYLAYRFINALEYLKKIRQILPSSTQPKQQLRNWIEQGNIQELLKAVQHILELMKTNEQQITKLFTEQINLIGYELLYLSLTLIPLLIISLYLLRQKFISYVYGRLKSIESVYKQFSWQILSENTYALNYFQNKLRNSKKK